jgi:hypothetical protein
MIDLSAQFSQMLTRHETKARDDVITLTAFTFSASILTDGPEPPVVLPSSVMGDECSPVSFREHWPLSIGIGVGS